MTRVIYSVAIDNERNLGTVIFENFETAKIYAKQCQAAGLNAVVVPRAMICDEPLAFGFRAEVQLAV